MALTKKLAQLDGSATVVTENVPAPAVNQTYSIGGSHKAGDRASSPMTKDDYWRNKETRDLENQPRIRRAGAWQAAIQSTGILQLNTNNTLEGFLALVEKAADAGVKYIEGK